MVRRPPIPESQQQQQQHGRQQAVQRRQRLLHAGSRQCQTGGQQHQQQQGHACAQARTAGPGLPGRLQGQPPQATQAHGQQLCQQDRAILQPESALDPLMCPQGDRQMRHHQPDDPQQRMAQSQTERQCQRCPQRKQLPGIGSGLVGLAKKRQQAAHTGQRQHAQCRCRQRTPTGQRPARQRRQQHGQSQQHKMRAAAPVVPVGSNRHQQAKSAQRCGQQHQNALQQWPCTGRRLFQRGTLMQGLLLRQGQRKALGQASQCDTGQHQSVTSLS